MDVLERADVARDFHKAFTRLLGAAVGHGRSGRRLTVACLESPLGPLLAGATERGLSFLEFSDTRTLEAQVARLARRSRCALLAGEDPVLARLDLELAEYFTGHRRAFSVPLSYPGTDFQVRVWDALREIPYGETTSYEALALRLGHAGAQRAVGAANGDNPIAIVIPCHRVVRKDGSLCGYGGGVWRKRRLLDLERGVTPLPL